MGYNLTTIANLPIDKENEFYVFVLAGNANWKGGILEKIYDNFDNLAKEIGSKSVIVKGLNPQQWTDELTSIYFGKKVDINAYVPGIIITDSHPDNFKNNSLCILISLNQVEKNFDNIEQFFNLLTDFTSRKNNRFIDVAKEKINWLQEFNNAIDLKPNFYGLGINLNSLLSLVINKNDKPIIKNNP